MRRLSIWFLLLLASTACDHKADEPVPEPLSSAAPGPRKVPPKPGASIPVPPDTTILPRASREPDWGLDPADPAKDYVTRYVQATKRYGDKACVVVRPSKFVDGKSVVETHNDATGACGKADELRDRFIVSVANDTMSLDESLHQPKLARWPDGSDPEGPAGKVMDVQDLHKWHAGLRDTFHKLELAPLRVQLYGRGTYPVVSVAGWHGAVQQTMSPAELEPAAKTLCQANEGQPLGILAGVDRSLLLRVMCPGSARFDTL